ncbi:RrF2 family transcriptional regulator [Candidatus Omnitrophota bacterium]
MKISSRLDYALSCILRVASKYSANKLTSISEICKKEKLEFDYVEGLLISMKKRGLLKSVRGRSGGYTLSMPPDKISVKDIVEAIEKDTLKLVCFRKGRKRKCVHLDDCRIKAFWMQFKNNIESFLENHTLKELLCLRKKEKNWLGR